MAIRIKDTYDPLTSQSYQHPEAPWIGIHPTNYFDVAPPIARLERLIQQYVSREISSCSVLIGGDRGAGKTSLVSKVIERLRRRQDGGITKETPLHEYWRFPRPLLVRVHGPQCMPDERTGGDRTNDAQEQSKFVLQEIAEALHRAIVDELGRVFAGLSEHASEAEREESAQFRLELDEGPSQARLREMWSLFARPGRVAAKFPARPDLAPKDQAWRELAAVASSMQLVREIRQHQEAGVQSRERNEAERNRTREEREEERKHRHDIGFWREFLRQTLDGGRLINPLGGLMVSLLVFFSFLKADINFTISALVGLLSGFAATVLLNFATAKKYANALLADSGLAAIDRTLPVVIRRLEYAGIFPVIVVDELDKLDGEHNALQSKMESLVKHLKTFCSDLSFVCFIVGRPYYEWVQQRTAGVVGDRHAVDTFFSHRILVSYSPKWLLDYLKNFVVVEQPASSEDGAVCSFLQDLYLYRSKGHLADLSAVVAADRKLDGTADVQPGLMIVPQYERQVRYQRAVSTVLEHPETKQLLRQAPDHLEPLMRTLYAPARLWEQERPSFTVNELSPPEIFLPMLQRLLRLLGEPKLDDQSKPIRKSVLLIQPEAEGSRYRWKYMFSRDAEFAAVPRMAIDRDITMLTSLSRMLAEVSRGRLGLHDLASLKLTGRKSRLIDYSFPVDNGWTGLLQIADHNQRLVEIALLADAVESSAQELRALLIIAALERSSSSPWIGLQELRSAESGIPTPNQAGQDFLDLAGERYRLLKQQIGVRGQLTQELKSISLGVFRVEALDIPSWSADVARLFRRARQWQPQP